MREMSTVRSSSTAVSGGPVDTRRILVGTLAVPLLLLSACGGNDSVADPPVSSAPASSDPTGPPQRETAEHFIRRWAVAEKQMENTGDLGPYMLLSKGCVPCTNLAKQI